MEDGHVGGGGGLVQRGRGLGERGREHAVAEVGGVLRARHLCRDVLLITVRTAAALTAQAAVAGAGLEAGLVTRLHPGETHAAIR